MTGDILVISGLFALVYGTWRGYVAARQAVLPLVRQGDETRTLIEAARPLHERSRVRIAARNVGLSLVWLAVAMYGLYLATVGVAVRA